MDIAQHLDFDSMKADIYSRSANLIFFRKFFNRDVIKIIIRKDPHFLFGEYVLEDFYALLHDILFLGYRPDVIVSTQRGERVKIGFQGDHIFIFLSLAQNMIDHMLCSKGEPPANIGMGFQNFQLVPGAQKYILRAVFCILRVYKITAAKTINKRRILIVKILIELLIRFFRTQFQSTSRADK